MLFSVVITFAVVVKLCLCCCCCFYESVLCVFFFCDDDIDKIGEKKMRSQKQCWIQRFSMAGEFQLTHQLINGFGFASITFMVGYSLLISNNFEKLSYQTCLFSDVPLIFCFLYERRNTVVVSGEVRSCERRST